MARTALTPGAIALKNAGSLSELVARTGLSRSMLASYRSGAASPSPTTADRLHQTLAIEPSAWASAADTEPESPVVVIANPRMVLRRAEANLAKLEAAGAHPRDLTNAIAEFRQATALVLKYSDESAEAIIATIIETLKAYPDAQDAVATALESRGAA